MTKMEFIVIMLLYIATVITLFAMLAKEKKRINLMHKVNVSILESLGRSTKRAEFAVQKLDIMTKTFSEIGLLEISTTMTNRQFDTPEAKTQAILPLTKQISVQQVNYQKEQLAAIPEMNHEDNLCKVTASIGIIPKFSREKLEALKGIFELQTEQHNYHYENSTN